MPSRDGMPIAAPGEAQRSLAGGAALPGGPLNPIDWLDLGGDEFAGLAQGEIMRGTPGMAAWQRKQIDGPATIPQSGPIYLHSRPYDRGAQAFSPKFGVLNINPIGAGVYAPYRLPTIAGPGARYAFAAIWFDVQTIPTSLHAAPTMPIDSVDALLATSSVGAMYATTG